MHWNNGIWKKEFIENSIYKNTIYIKVSVKLTSLAIFEAMKYSTCSITFITLYLAKIRNTNNTGTVYRNKPGYSVYNWESTPILSNVYATLHKRPFPNTYYL